MLNATPLDQLVEIIIVAVGVSFVITGASIGKPIRFVGWLLLHRLHLDAIVRCPFCNAWWMGLSISILLSEFDPLMWFQWLQAAFASCGVAAIVQAQWGLAADEDFGAALRQESQEE